MESQNHSKRHFDQLTRKMTSDLPFADLKGFPILPDTEKDIHVCSTRPTIVMWRKLSDNTFLFDENMSRLPTPLSMHTVSLILKSK